MQSALHSYKNGNNGKIEDDTIDRRWTRPASQISRHVNDLFNQPVRLPPARQSLGQGRARSVSSSAPTAPLITFRQISSLLIPASGIIPARPCPCKEEGWLVLSLPEPRSSGAGRRSWPTGSRGGLTNKQLIYIIHTQPFQSQTLFNYACVPR